MQRYIGSFLFLLIFTCKSSEEEQLQKYPLYAKDLYCSGKAQIENITQILKTPVEKYLPSEAHHIVDQIIVLHSKQWPNYQNKLTDNPYLTNGTGTIKDLLLATVGISQIVAQLKKEALRKGDQKTCPFQLLQQQKSIFAQKVFSGSVPFFHSQGISRYMDFNILAQINLTPSVKLSDQNALVLSANASGLTSFKGITQVPGFDKIQILDCKYNHFRELPDFSQRMPDIKIINVSHNDLETFPLYLHNLQLIALYLDKNAISTLPETPLPYLEILTITDNMLHRIPANFSSFFPKLKKLNLSSNPIMKFHSGAFSSLRKLEEINLKNILIKDLEAIRLYNEIKQASPKAEIIWQHPDQSLITTLEQVEEENRKRQKTE